jgi:hypothetical protein
MAKEPPFVLVYDPGVVDHLDAIELKYHSLIRDTIEEQLKYEPETETHNRKRLLRIPEFGARWELRLRPQNRFRVYYRVETAQREVQILGIGVKLRDRLYIAGEEVKL